MAEADYGSDKLTIDARYEELVKDATMSIAMRRAALRAKAMAKVEKTVADAKVKTTTRDVAAMLDADWEASGVKMKVAERTTAIESHPAVVAAVQAAVDADIAYTMTAAEYDILKMDEKLLEIRQEQLNMVAAMTRDEVRLQPLTR